MDKPTLYIEATIPSYLLAEQARDIIALRRQEITKRWWERDHSRYAFFVSDVVMEEIEKGDRQAARKRREFLGQFPVLAFPEKYAKIRPGSGNLNLCGNETLAKKRCD